MTLKRWIIRKADPVVAHQLCQELGVAPAVAQILAARGFTSPQKAYAFLHPSTSQLHDPFLFEEMNAIMERLTRAREKREKILLYGDYDVDGITATALLSGVMRQLGFQVDYFIPNRFKEGYGLNTERLEQAKAMGISLVVTLDCGTKEVEPVEQAVAMGLEVIVTDHHFTPEQLPPAHIILNPHKPGCRYPDRNLCGVGIAYKVAQALIRHLDEGSTGVEDQLDLVAIGTIADIVPLVGENRVLVREGMKRLRHTRRVGLLALMESARVVLQQVGVRDVGYSLAPRINALGRLGDAISVVRLLLTDQEEEAFEITRLMGEANTDRQRLQESVMNDIRRLADAEPEKFSGPLIFLAGEDWHRGVIGIAASKVSETYHRPAILFSIDGNTAHGSARSIPGVHITEALEACSDLLDRFGGHRLASGVTLPTRNLFALEQRLTDMITKQMTGEDSVPLLEIDAEVRLDEIDEELVEQLQDLAPFGAGNPRPLLVAHGLSAGDTARVVGNGSLKFMVAQGNTLLDAIAFSQAHRLDSLDLNSLDVAFFPEINDWRGQRSIQLKVQDVRTSEGTTPVSASLDSGSTSAVRSTALRVRKIIGDTLEDCWKAFEKRCNGKCVALIVDHPDRKAQLEKESPQPVRIEIEVDFRGEAPDVWLILPGRRSPDAVRGLLKEASIHHPESELWLGVVREEVNQIHATLDDLYPERENLLTVYKQVKDAFGTDYFEMEDAVMAFRQFSRPHLVSCFKVFEELELVERHADRSRLCFRRVRSKRDLLMAPTYRQGQALRQNWLAWLTALEGTEDDVQRFLAL